MQSPPFTHDVARALNFSAVDQQKYSCIPSPVCAGNVINTSALDSWKQQAKVECGDAHMGVICRFMIRGSIRTGCSKNRAPFKRGLVRCIAHTRFTTTPGITPPPQVHQFLSALQSQPNTNQPTAQAAHSVSPVNADAIERMRQGAPHMMNVVSYASHKCISAPIYTKTSTGCEALLAQEFNALLTKVHEYFDRLSTTATTSGSPNHTPPSPHIPRSPVCASPLNVAPMHNPAVSITSPAFQFNPPPSSTLPPAARRPWASPLAASPASPRTTSPHARHGSLRSHHSLGRNISHLAPTSPLRGSLLGSPGGYHAAGGPLQCMSDGLQPLLQCLEAQGMQVLCT